MFALSLNSDWCLSVRRGLSGGNLLWEKEKYVEEERDVNNFRMSLGHFATGMKLTTCDFHCALMLKITNMNNIIIYWYKWKIILLPLLKQKTKPFPVFLSASTLYLPGID